MSNDHSINGPIHSRRGWLLAVVAIFVGVAALRFASVTSVVVIVQVATALVVLAVCVRAVAERGRRQAFAIGFATCVLAYWLVRATGAPFFADHFGTDLLSDRLYAHLTTTTWVDRSTGQEFDYDPRTRPVPNGATDVASASGEAGFALAEPSSTARDLFQFDDPDSAAGSLRPARQYSRRDWPGKSDFRSVANCFWTLLLGVAGGKFAAFLHPRRREESTR